MLSNKDNYSHITLVKRAIHNPKEPRHFMTVTPTDFSISVEVQGERILESKALECMEVAHLIIRPVYYFTKNDFNTDLLIPSERETTCPLKGKATYYHLKIDHKVIKDAVWCYHEVISIARALKDKFAFDTNLVKVRPL